MSNRERTDKMTWLSLEIPSAAQGMLHQSTWQDCTDYGRTAVFRKGSWGRHHMGELQLMFGSDLI